MRRDWVGWTALGLAVVATVVLYPRLPERLAVHWNVYGQPDRWAGRNGVIAVGIGLLAGIYALFGVLPQADPWRHQYRRFAGAYRLIRTAIVAAGSLLYTLVLLVGAGEAVRIDRWVPVVVGALLVIIGNVLGQLRPNFFVGIRTPWTLADEEVWRRTHRLGAWLFVGAGFAMVAGGAAGGWWAAATTALAVAVAAGGSIGASYGFWRQRQLRRQP